MKSTQVSHIWKSCSRHTQVMLERLSRAKSCRTLKFLGGLSYFNLGSKEELEVGDDTMWLAFLNGRYGFGEENGLKGSQSGSKGIISLLGHQSGPVVLKVWYRGPRSFLQTFQWVHKGNTIFITFHNYTNYLPFSLILSYPLEFSRYYMICPQSSEKAIKIFLPLQLLVRLSIYVLQPQQRISRD